MFLNLVKGLSKTLTRKSEHAGKHLWTSWKLWNKFFVTDLSVSCEYYVIVISMMRQENYSKKLQSSCLPWHFLDYSTNNLTQNLKIVTHILMLISFPQGVEPRCQCEADQISFETDTSALLVFLSFKVFFPKQLSDAISTKQIYKSV